MRILLVSPKGDGAWFAWKLKSEGHTVDWIILDHKYDGCFDGILPARATHPDPAKYDLVVFDSDGHGQQADAARELVPTIGSSVLADKLEDDRLFGLEVMEQAGIRVPRWEAFDSPEKGIAWLKANNMRTVFKPVGEVPGDDKSTTYVSKGTDDMIAFMERVFQKAHIKSYILQEVVLGTETAVGGWFNGTDWVVVDHNIELKKMMNDDVGPNTGCAAMCVWLPPRPTPMFQQGLEKITPFLRENNYVGPIDLNIIVTEGEAYGLEWTPRFAYEGTANLTALLNMPFSEFLSAVAAGATPTFTQSHQFSVTLRAAVPPYPNAELSRKKLIVPILGVDIAKLDRMVLYDVKNVDGQLQTTGIYNCIGAPIRLGDTIEGAFAEALAALKGLNVPDLMYRTDAGKKINARYQELQRKGWLKSIG